MLMEHVINLSLQMNILLYGNAIFPLVNSQFKSHPYGQLHIQGNSSYIDIHRLKKTIHHLRSKFYPQVVPEAPANSFFNWTYKLFTLHSPLDPNFPNCPETKTCACCRPFRFSSTFASKCSLFLENSWLTFLSTEYRRFQCT